MSNIHVHMHINIWLCSRATIHLTEDKREEEYLRGGWEMRGGLDLAGEATTNTRLTTESCSNPNDSSSVSVRACIHIYIRRTERQRQTDREAHRHRNGQRHRHRHRHRHRRRHRHRHTHEAT